MNGRGCLKILFGVGTKGQKDRQFGFVAPGTKIREAPQKNWRKVKELKLFWRNKPFRRDKLIEYNRGVRGKGLTKEWDTKEKCSKRVVPDQQLT